MKILYVGPLTYGSTSLHRCQAFMDLGHEVITIDTFSERLKRLLHKNRNLLDKIIFRVLYLVRLTRVNRRIVEVAQKNDLDLLWIDKGLGIRPGSLKKVKALSPLTKIVGYSPDDMVSRHNLTKKWRQCLPLYHAYCTNRAVNVQELRALGGQQVILVDKAYDPYTHRPLPVSAEEKRRLGGPVGFIGDYELQRAQSLLFLAQQGIPVRIWGPNWKRSRLRHRNLRIEGASLWGDDYARAICAFDINLSFLRKIHRDLHDSRSFEIPACGAFMLAERTPVHLELFEEGKEAEFFGSDEELLAKVRYYLEHDAARRQIARAGRERCLRSGYSNHERLKTILTLIE